MRNINISDEWVPLPGPLRADYLTLNRHKAPFNLKPIKPKASPCSFTQHSKAR